MEGGRASERRGPLGADRVLHQLRHEAGLAAGRVLDLRAGRYEIGPTGDGSADDTPSRVSFVLDVSPDKVTLSPRADETWLDGTPVTGPTEVFTDQVIRVGGDLFFAIDPRVRPRERVRLTPPPPPLASRRRRLRRRAADEQRERQMTRFANDIDRAAAAERRRRRRGVGLSSEIGRAIERGRTLELESPTHVAIGLSNEAENFWPDDLPPDQPAEITAILTRRAKIVAAPVVVDLGRERLGLAGPPQATLAVARHLLLALAANSPETPVSFPTDHPGGWGGLDAVLSGEDPGLAVTIPAHRSSTEDRTASSRRAAPAPGIVIGESRQDIDDCEVQLVVDETGQGTFERRGGTRVPVVVIGSSVERTEQLAEQLVGRVHGRVEAAPPRSFSHGAVLVSGADRAANNVILASLALDLLGRPNNEGLEMFIIDRPDRSLMRLKQLPQTSGYAAADDPDRLVELLHSLERRTSKPSENTAILLVSELGPLTEFLRRLGRTDLIDQVDQALQAHDRVELLVAASGPDEPSVGDDLLVRFPSRLRCEDGLARLHSESGERALALGELADRDLTRAVANLLPTSSPGG